MRHSPNAEVDRAIRTTNDERSLRAKAERQRRVEQIETLGFLFDQMDRDGNANPPHPTPF